ncbi:hypothetical protein [Umezawaea sp. Da 62-37]|nr:hypothetical protein [Umezawaea sp. Da 62-37]WNV87384.1 hypothetical protein RM788_03525 [Umezawaea sp. Da 62-37]
MSAVRDAVAKASGPVTEVGPRWTVDDLRPRVNVVPESFESRER